jgi:inosine-uridine nucleoside N-ribohydrolase
VPRKVFLITDPGIDGAFAVALALHDPELDVVAIAATAGNVSAEDATRNTHILIEQFDPPRWPRLGGALAVEYPIDARNLHGPNGLGGQEFPCARLHHPLAGDKLLADMIREHPKSLTVVVMGPATLLARVLDREPELAPLVERIVLVGGSWHEPGDTGPGTEFHFACDPAGARKVLRCGAPVTLLPLDVTRKLVFAPGDLVMLKDRPLPACRFLSQVMPHAIGTTASLYGTEGVYLQDVLGVTAAARPELFTLRGAVADVELRGELTTGMSVIDTRWSARARPNLDLATDADIRAVRQHIARVLYKSD